MLEFQPDLNFDSWPKWPFVVLAIVLFLPGALIIALAFVAWIRSPQWDAKGPAASMVKDDAGEEKPKVGPLD